MYIECAFDVRKILNLLCKEKLKTIKKKKKNKSMASHCVKTMLFKEITARNKNKKISLCAYDSLDFAMLIALFLQRTILKI